LSKAKGGRLVVGAKGKIIFYFIFGGVDHVLFNLMT